MKKILFVCTGNICRSPTAEGVFRARVAAAGWENDILIDSAGTHDYHAGQPPDRRSIYAAKQRGFDLKSFRARKVSAKDFSEFDLILALDYEHLEHLQRMAPKQSKAVLGLFLDYAGHATTRDVPDPYYGESRGFEEVLDLIETGSDLLLERITKEWMRR